jgi:hypothetical protein
VRGERTRPPASPLVPLPRHSARRRPGHPTWERLNLHRTAVWVLLVCHRQTDLVTTEQTVPMIRKLFAQAVWTPLRDIEDAVSVDWKQTMLLPIRHPCRLHLRLAKAQQRARMLRGLRARTARAVDQSRVTVIRGRVVQGAFLRTALLDPR